MCLCVPGLPHKLFNRVDRKLLVEECIPKIAKLRNNFFKGWGKFFLFLHFFEFFGFFGIFTLSVPSPAILGGFLSDDDDDPSPPPSSPPPPDPPPPRGLVVSRMRVFFFPSLLTK